MHLGCQSVLPGCAILRGDERVRLARARGDRTLGNAADTIHDVGIVLAEAMIVDRGAIKRSD